MNERPVARIVVDVAVGGAPLTVSFDGSTSSDPDGQIQGFAWTFGDGATGAGMTTTHTYTTPGNYVAALTVTDDRGATGSTTDSISVNTRVGDGTNTIRGTVWYDRDGNGSRSAEEGGLEGFRVFIDEDGDGVRDPLEFSAVTDATGSYTFLGVDSTRSHVVRQELTFGWTNTFPAPTGGSDHAVPLLAARVVGGSDAPDGTFPFQVALLASAQPDPTRGQFCGGTLIAAQWVMTAAHCVEGSDPSDIDVLVGTTNLGSGGARIAVQSIRIYPAYGERQGIDNDLALLKLDQPLMRSRVALNAPAGTDYATPGTVATVVGWGLTQASGQPSQLLQMGSTPILANQDCAVAYPELTDAMMCTTQEGGVDACQGDSGGPLAVQGPLGWVQVGIVSFGLRCAAFPGVYARVSTLYDYVEATVPAEPSAAVNVMWATGQTEATVDFGNFR